MPLTHDELTNLNRRQNHQLAALWERRGPRSDRAGGLLELGVARRPRNMVIAWVRQVWCNYTGLPCFGLFRSTMEKIGYVDFISPNKNIKESRCSTARFLAPSRSSESILLSFADTWDIQHPGSRVMQENGVKYSRRDSPTATNVCGVHAWITRRKEYEHEEKRCRHQHSYSLPFSLILTHGYKVSSLCTKRQLTW